jgi:hypothetical protein
VAFRPGSSLYEQVVYAVWRSTNELRHSHAGSVRVRGSLGLTLLVPSSELASFGQCWFEVSTMLECLSHCRAPGSEVYAPYPTSPWFGPLQRYFAPDILGENKVVVEHPVAHIRRSFDFGPLRLAGYWIAPE